MKSAALIYFGFVALVVSPFVIAGIRPRPLVPRSRVRALCLECRVMIKWNVDDGRDCKTCGSTIESRWSA